MELAIQPIRPCTYRFFGPFRGMDFLVLVDSHSKWIEVAIMQNTNALQTIATLRKWFSQFGFPLQIVSDNGPQFTSTMFSNFCKINGIKHIRSSAYHPSSNGGAERFVQTIKRAQVAADIKRGDAEIKLQAFLQDYRATPTTTTGLTPRVIYWQANPNQIRYD